MQLDNAISEVSSLGICILKRVHISKLNLAPDNHQNLQHRNRLPVDVLAHPWGVDCEVKCVHNQFLGFGNDYKIMSSKSKHITRLMPHFLHV